MTREEQRALARKNVATWPPFSAEQRDRLWVLLAPMREALAELARQRAAEARRGAA